MTRLSLQYLKLSYVSIVPDLKYEQWTGVIVYPKEFANNTKTLTIFHRPQKHFHQQKSDHSF